MIESPAVTQLQFPVDDGCITRKDDDYMRLVNMVYDDTMTRERMCTQVGFADPVINMVYDDTMTRERMCRETGFADPVTNGVLALYAFSKRPTGSRYGVHYAYVLFTGSIEQRARMLYDGRIGRTDVWRVVVA